MKMVVWVFCGLLVLAMWVTGVAPINQDGEVLLEMKWGFNDTHGFLHNWKKSDDSPCKWTGVICNHHDQRVRSLNLPYLHLGGIISPNIGRLSKLRRLALHGNSLHGYIPAEIGSLTQLRALYLKDNYLEGGIPEEIGNLTDLRILDLSSNLLKGPIPTTLGHLTRLQFLNLSTNFLSGEIPTMGTLITFNNYSFLGNLDLCGHQVQKLCKVTTGFPAVLPVLSNETDSSCQPKRTFNLYGLLIAAMSVMGLCLILLLAILWICFLSKTGKFGKSYSKVHQQQNRVETDSGVKLITFHGDLPYSSDDIIKRLELLDEMDIIGAGGFGIVYKLEMGDNCALAVKRIDGCHEGHNQTFERELEILGTIKHINLVNLRGYCSFPTAKFLIYDYVINGSLDYCLHESEQPEHLLNWSARLSIALGSARGLAYLHHDCCPGIVHRDIKSSNILLNEKLEPHVSDFGLAKLLVDNESHQVTTVVAGTFGYLAPEYLQSGKATAKTDVYSFGVLLLELISGRRPTDPVFVKKGLNVVGWLNTLVRENRLLEMVDDKCSGVDAESAEAVVDIAVKCTDASHHNRPSMNKVLQMLEEVVMSPCPSEFYDTHSDAE